MIIFYYDFRWYFLKWIKGEINKLMILERARQIYYKKEKYDLLNLIFYLVFLI